LCSFLPCLVTPASLCSAHNAEPQGRVWHVSRDNTIALIYSRAVASNAFFKISCPWSLRTCFLIFPLPVLGKSSSCRSQNKCSGALCQPKLCRTNSRMASAAGCAWNSRYCRKAPTTSPYLASGIPTTLAWIMAGCWTSRSSISIG
jgi:hypothetical protein